MLVWTQHFIAKLFDFETRVSADLTQRRTLPLCAVSASFRLTYSKIIRLFWGEHANDPGETGEQHQYTGRSLRRDSGTHSDSLTL